MMTSVSVALAFTAGLLSSLSPCVLPLWPSYVSYLSGLSVAQLTDTAPRASTRRTALSHGLAFVAGFMILFTLLGATATALGQWLGVYQVLIRKAGGILVIVFGLFIAGWLPLPWLARERLLTLKAKPAGLAGSALIGCVFALGWTPCIGPILAGVLVLASQLESVGRGIGLLAAYSVGLGLPFLVAAVATDYFLAHVRWLTRYAGWIARVSGLLLIGFGLALVTNAFGYASQALVQYFPSWTGATTP